MAEGQSAFGSHVARPPQPTQPKSNKGALHEAGVARQIPDGWTKDARILKTDTNAVPMVMDKQVADTTGVGKEAHVVEPFGMAQNRMSKFYLT